MCISDPRVSTKKICTKFHPHLKNVRRNYCIMVLQDESKIKILLSILNRPPAIL